MRGSKTEVPSDLTYWVTSSDDEDYQNVIRDFIQPIDDEDPVEGFMNFHNDGGFELDVEPHQNNIQGDEHNEQAEDLLYFYIDVQQEPQSNVNIIEMLEEVNKVNLTEAYKETPKSDENIEHHDGPGASDDTDSRN